MSLRAMTWLKRLLGLLMAVVPGLVVVAAGGFYLSYRALFEPPIADPERSLLSWRQPAMLPAERFQGKPAWLREARQHQQAPIDIVEFESPALRFGPWTRWWWPGNLVEPQELQRQMHVFADVGIAGVEIQPFAISLSEQDLALSEWHTAGWDSPAFYKNLQHTLNIAATLGMQVDLNNGSGWPTGGPHVALEDGLQQLLHSELIARGPTSLHAMLPAPAMPVTTYLAGMVGALGKTPMQTFAQDKRQLLAVTASRITQNQRSRVPWNFQDQITLAPDSTLDLSRFVEGETLTWEVPEGDWAITAFWQLPGGELIAGGYAHPQPGYVVDHLDAARMNANQHYLYRSETGLAPYFGNTLRAIFNDSLEFRQERHWARDHLQAFRNRLGYEPVTYLQALPEPGKDQMPFHALNIATHAEYDLGSTGERFLQDWESVTSDLFRERYLHTVQTWAAERGLAHRLQAYGGPIDIVAAAGESDIPEAEQLYAGGSEMFLKAVASGAQIADKPIVSAESFIFVGRAFMTTPLKIKALADKAFVAGINQLVFHGSSYNIPHAAERGYPQEDGWYPWQLGLLSTDYSENWNFWQYAPDLNRYIARNQYLLRKGKLEADVLFLYPGVGFPQGYGNPEEPFDQGKFSGEEPLGLTQDDNTGRGVQQMRGIWREARKLEQQGLTWAWINEEALLSAAFEDDKLLAGALQARVLRLHRIESLAPDSAEKIERLAAAGLPVQITGSVPQRQRGLKNFEEGDARVTAALSNLSTGSAIPSPPVEFSHADIKSLRRRLPNGDVLQLFTNPTSRPVTLEATSTAPNANWLDPWTGKSKTASTTTSGRFVHSLPAYGAVYLWLSNSESASPSYPTGREKQPTELQELSDWSLSVAGKMVQRSGTLPGNWRDIPALKNSAGPGIYRTRFEIKQAQLDSDARGNDIFLELTDIGGAAHVIVNGTSVGHLLVPPYALNITPALKTGTNTLEVRLIVPRKNRIIRHIKQREPGWNAPELIGTEAGVAVGIFGRASLVRYTATP